MQEGGATPARYHNPCAASRSFAGFEVTPMLLV